MGNPIRKIFGALALTAMLVVGACNSQDNADKAEAATPVAATAPAAPTATTSVPATPGPLTPVDIRRYSAPVTIELPAAKTPTEIMNCVVAGLKADGRTLAQARSLPGTADVTINNVKQKLGDGNSYYTLCAGPSLQERLTASSANLTRALDSFTAANAKIDEARPFVYVDVTGPLTRENTQVFRAEQAEATLENAQSWDWVQNLLIIIFGAALIFVIIQARRPMTAT